MLIDSTTGNPVEPQRAGSPLFGGPITRPDGLAADTPGRSIGARIPILFHPVVRLVIFAALFLPVFVLGAGFARHIPAALGGPGMVLAGAAMLAYLVLTVLVERRRPPAELAPVGHWGWSGGGLPAPSCSPSSSV